MKMQSMLDKNTNKPKKFSLDIDAIGMSPYDTRPQYSKPTIKSEVFSGMKSLTEDQNCLRVLFYETRKSTEIFCATNASKSIMEDRGKLSWKFSCPYLYRRKRTDEKRQVKTVPLHEFQ